MICNRCKITTKLPPKRIKEIFFKPKQPSKRKRKPHCVFDIESKGGCFVYDSKGRPTPVDETTQEKGFSRPFLLDFFDGQEHQSFRSDPNPLARWDEIPSQPGGLVFKFLNWLFHGGKDYWESTEADVKRYQNIPIYAHNGGRFDFGFLYRTLETLSTYSPGYKYNFNTISVPSRTLSVTVWRTKVLEHCENCYQCSKCTSHHYCRACYKKSKVSNKWTFYDSAAIISLSLEKAAKTFKVKTKLSHDLDMQEDDPRWEDYVRRDCEALHEVIESFAERIESFGGSMKTTQAAIAMNIFSTQYLKRNIFRDVASHDFIRDSYVGGRTEALIRYGRDLGYWDYNSSYPASMKERQPVSFSTKITGMSEDEIFERNQNQVGFVDCVVQVPQDCWLPPLPYKSDKLIFPTGTFRGKYHSEELALLRHPFVNGKILRTYDSYWYDTDFIFAEYVDTLYKIKSTPKDDPSYDEGLIYIIKLLLNSLYGKFGQSPERHQLVYVKLGDNLPLRGEPLHGSMDQSDFWEIPVYADAPYIIPQIAANVTAKSRIKLWLGCVDILMQGYKVYYLDTDSITCDRAAKIQSGTELGQLKFEKFLKEAEHVSPKFYRMLLEDDTWIHKIKGVWGEMLKGRPDTKPGESDSDYKVRLDDEQLKAKEVFDSLLRGETIKKKTFTQQKTMIRNRHSVPFEFEAKKTATGINSKRVNTGHASGYTKPIHIVEKIS